LGKSEHSKIANIDAAIIKLATFAPSWITSSTPRRGLGSANFQRVCLKAERFGRCPEPRQSLSGGGITEVGHDR
jgi:hypothetical protein